MIRIKAADSCLEGGLGIPKQTKKKQILSRTFVIPIKINLFNGQTQNAKKIQLVDICFPSSRSKNLRHYLLYSSLESTSEKRQLYVSVLRPRTD